MRQYKNGLIMYDDVLPKHMMRGRECIWWEMTPQIIMRIEYQGIKKHVQFISYFKRYITYLIIENGEKEYTNCINTFICHGGCLKNAFPELVNSINWKYSIGDIINDKFKIIDKQIRNRERKDTDYSYIAHEKMYKVQCLKCKYISEWAREDAIKNKTCMMCAGKVLSNGINDLATTHPELESLLINSDDIYSYSKGSNRWLDVKCPFCGSKSKQHISNLCGGKYVCQYCKDGISTNEKYFIDILNQLNAHYIYQLSGKNFDWCNTYRFDFFLSDYSTIIEVNGIEHYENTYITNIDNIRLNDYKKKELALKNGIKNYIYVDAKYTNSTYLKNSIQNNEGLKQIFNISDIDYDKAWNFSQISFLQETCKYWNLGYGIRQITSLLPITENTIRKYLKKCNDKELLAIPYSKKENIKRNRNHIGDDYAKKTRTSIKTIK